MAHTKAQGSVKGNRDSRAKRLGVKHYTGETVQPGSILVRQKGSKFHPGDGVLMGRDYTLFSVISGKVNFKLQKGRKLIEVING